MKTRLLNASHCALGYLGVLAGLGRTDEVMADDVLHEYVARLMREEIAPLLPCPEGIDLDEYMASLVQRFANPAIGDKLERLCRRGSTKVVNYLLPSLCSALEEGRPTDLLALAIAGWFRYLRGEDLDGQPIDVQDAHAGELRERALAGGTDPCPLLEMRSLFGDLADRPEFTAALETAMVQLDRDGVRATLATHLTAAGSASSPAPVDDEQTASSVPA
jgi:fructuronate reductase/mannitol 2-dehydrogenase